MSSSPPRLTEAARLQILRDYAVLDTAPDRELDEIVALAAAICEVPIALISLVDETRQWFKASVGLAAKQTPRDQAFCAHVIAAESDELFTVPDARKDPRFQENPLVTGAPEVVFYAGAPLSVEEGAKLGTLCVIDSKPRELSSVQVAALDTLSKVVVAHLARKREVVQKDASEAWLRAILSSMSEGVVAVDATGVITFLNAVAERLSGWSSGDAIGAPFDKVVHVFDEGGRSPVDVREMADSAPASTRTERLVLRRRDGHFTPIECRATPIRNGIGDARGTNFMFRDIHVEREAEDDLRAIAERLSRVMEASNTGAWEIDLTNESIVVDERHRLLIGFSSNDGTMERAFAAVHEDDREKVKDAVRAATEGEGDGRYQSEYRTRGTPMRWISSRGKVLRDANGRALRLSGASVDITERKLADEALKKQAEFEQQLIGIVSHDLRNPLNVITMGSQLLQRQANLEPQAQRTLQLVERATERATNMVRDLLDFTQARLGGGIRISPAPASLAAIVQLVKDETEAAHPTRAITLRDRFDVWGSWDADRVAQALANLVTNAIKYSPEGTPVVLGVTVSDALARVTVHNEGPPISPEKLSTLFEPYQRAVGQVDSVTRSIGLGLYIVHKLVEAHGGRVDVRSAEGEGTTFSFTLPTDAASSSGDQGGSSR